VCAFFLAETFKRDLSMEPEDEAAAALGARASAHSPRPLPR
jgi:MFS transporter, MHS family, shikimate and dehydroshikimate transport protein